MREKGFDRKKRWEGKILRFGRGTHWEEKTLKGRKLRGKDLKRKDIKEENYWEGKLLRGHFKRGGHWERTWRGEDIERNGRW